MNAPIAPPSASTPKTSSTAGANGANSATIAGYIRERFAEADSEKHSTMKSSAEAALRHGFTACANLQYAAFLEAYQNTPLREHYEAHYPQCYFLPWGAFRNLLHALDLWCELPRFYAGGIPPEQLPWLDVFALSLDDTVRTHELAELNPEASDNWRVVLNASFIFGHLRDERLRKFVDPMRRLIEEFTTSWFVVAPKAAFLSDKDFITRVQEVTLDAKNTPKTPPHDPLIIRFVRGGCLVVAAWGDEAAYINEAVYGTKPIIQ